jgi:hypothetical protein
LAHLWSESEYGNEHGTFLAHIWSETEYAAEKGHTVIRHTSETTDPVTLHHPPAPGWQFPACADGDNHDEVDVLSRFK